MAKRNTIEQRALRVLLVREGNQKLAAKALGISSPYFNDLLHGRRACSARILSRLGLKSIIVERQKASA